IAGHIEHRDLERILRPRALPRPRPSQGRLKIESRVALSPRTGASQLGCGRGSIRSGGTPGQRGPVGGGGGGSGVVCGGEGVGGAGRGPDARYAKGLGAAAVVRFVVLRRDRAHSLRVDAQSASGRDGESVFRRLSVRGVAGRPPGARCVPNARVTKLILRPEIGRDYPLNLSILLSGGKETNKDSLSNGE